MDTYLEDLYGTPEESENGGAKDEPVRPLAHDQMGVFRVVLGHVGNDIGDVGSSHYFGNDSSDVGKCGGISHPIFKNCFKLLLQTNTLKTDLMQHFHSYYRLNNM